MVICCHNVGAMRVLHYHSVDVIFVDIKLKLRRHQIVHVLVIQKDYILNLLGYCVSLTMNFRGINQDAAWALHEIHMWRYMALSFTLPHPSCIYMRVSLVVLRLLHFNSYFNIARYCESTKLSLLHNEHVQNVLLRTGHATLHFTNPVISLVLTLFTWCSSLHSTMSGFLIPLSMLLCKNVKSA